MLVSPAHVASADKQITWPLLVILSPVLTVRSPAIWLLTVHVLSMSCPVYCNICKSPAHRARTCPFSWSRLVDFPAPTSDSTPSNTEHSEHSENSESTESTNSDNATTDSNADISDPVLDNTPTVQPSDRPSETSPMNDDSPTVEETTVDQDSSDSTIQHYASASEENTMELFSEPQSSSRSAGSGRNPAKILDAFIPFR